MEPLNYRNAAKYIWVGLLKSTHLIQTSAPRKRTAFGRMGHEGAMPGITITSDQI